MKCSPYVLIIDEGGGPGPAVEPHPVCCARPPVHLDETASILCRFYFEPARLASSFDALLLLHGRSPVPAVCLSVCLSPCLFVHLFVYLLVCLSVYLDCLATTSCLSRLLFFPRDADGATFTHLWLGRRSRRRLLFRRSASHAMMIARARSIAGSHVPV